MKFAAFVVQDAKVLGKDAALATKTPFDEKELIEHHRPYIFENFPVPKRSIHMQAEEVDAPNSEAIRAGAVPGKPAIMVFGEIPQAS